ncbi:MAG: serine/threonine protein kinase, partial [Planctomycetes bacterium]|nr:serine/threonine protein kinase [Planctomycetota bacterium]
MKRERWKKIRELLEQVLALDAPERQQYLSNACGADDRMRAEVESILSASETDPEFMKASVADIVAVDADDDLRSLIGQMAGPFRLERFIASGGMGSVFLGTNTDGEQPAAVAVKLLKHRVATTEMLRRFHVERQSLSALSHSNIACAIDAGVLANGRPYLVMEYVAGTPIDLYCDEHRLSIKHRLELFRTVCAAVSHAHQRLIVHRDLKPSNILVTPDGTPKLLDFGISKAIDTLEPTLSASNTETQHRVMTPEYASPEQIRGAIAATSGDIYSLGVVLYELLTGHRPYQFKSRTPHEMERTICEQEPDTPSNAVFRTPDPNSLDGAARPVPTPEQVGLARNELPSRLRSQLTGDLDAIVMKSLRKEPEYRYSSVDAFSEDVGRYLDGAPVAARRGTRRYRFLKFVERNKAAVMGSAVAVVSLAIGLAIALWQGHVAVQAQQLAEAEARNARSANEFVQGMLAGVDPLAAESDDTTVRQILDDASNRLALGALRGQPESKASVHLTLGRTYLELGAFDAAETHLQAAMSIRTETLGRRRPAVAECLSGLGMLAKAKGQYEAADTFYRESLEIREAVLGRRHIDTAESLNNLGVLLKLQGRYAESEKLLREALSIRRATLPERHEDVATTSSNLAAVLKNLGVFDSAEALYREALDTYQEIFGPEHLRVAGCMNNLALLLRERGDIKSAETLLRDALAIRRRVFGDDHPAIAALMSPTATQVVGATALIRLSMADSSPANPSVGGSPRQGRSTPKYRIDRPKSNRPASGRGPSAHQMLTRSAIGL